jgi:hypothetical protein
VLRAKKKSSNHNSAFLKNLIAMSEAERKKQSKRRSRNRRTNELSGIDRKAHAQ